MSKRCVLADHENLVTHHPEQPDCCVLDLPEPCSCEEALELRRQVAELEAQAEGLAVEVKQYREHLRGASAEAGDRLIEAGKLRELAGERYPQSCEQSCSYRQSCICGAVEWNAKARALRVGK